MWVKHSPAQKDLSTHHELDLLPGSANLDFAHQKVPSLLVKLVFQTWICLMAASTGLACMRPSTQGDGSRKGVV